ncbi:MAG: hypothetical protein WCB10_10665 [Steroidobacteraceae bacterium]
MPGYFLPHHLCLTVRYMKTIRLSLFALICSAAQAAQATPLISLSQTPLVMRLSKDEFRIAFGINGEQCAPNGCHGLIRYRVDWRTEGGVTRSELKQVDFAVSPQSGRSITVDRQYFDTAEGAHTTEVVNVSVDAITCFADPDPHTP